jgi:FKBP-type peptidyl-prolyl cis-trans isomerase
MKKALLAGLLAFATTSLFAQQKTALKTALDSASYAYGVTAAKTVLKTMAAEFKNEAFLAAIKAVVNNEPLLIQEADAKTTTKQYDTKAQGRIAEAWKAENTAFLDKNKLRKEVTTTASGLQYEVMKRGTGTVSPKATDKVEVHYHGTMIDGEVFDSSVRRNQTASFGLNQVIKGWTEGLQYMKEGDKFKFFIPYNLAYGEQARSAVIKGYSTLIFEVELFKVNP